MVPLNNQLITLEKSDIPYLLFSWPIVTNKQIIASQEALIIGRAFHPEEDLNKEDEYRHLSRYHSEIVAVLIEEKISAYVFDLRSVNGTFLNGVRLREGMVRALKDGDNLVFADIETKVFLKRK